MSAPTGVTDASASLLEADPTLARTLGPRDAAERGHALILPVLSVPAGPWEPPDRAVLGAGTVALVVLDGLLAADAPPAMLGPGDVLEPWDSRASWTACTPLRLVLIGSRFIHAVEADPGAAARLLARARARPAQAAGGGGVDERVLAALWRIAGRWGLPDGEAVALPHAVDVRALAALLRLGEPDVAGAVALLVVQGTVVKRPGRGWSVHAGSATPVPFGYSRERRDDLRARGAQQLAIARLARADYESLSEQLQGELARQRQRRGE